MIASSSNSASGRRSRAPTLLTRMSSRPWRALDVGEGGALRIPIGDVEGCGFGTAARRNDRTHRLVKRCGRAAVDDDMRSGFGNRASDLKPQPASATGHQGDPALQGKSFDYAHGSIHSFFAVQPSR